MKSNIIINIPDYEGIGVYQLINNENDKKYIGSSINVKKRINQHEHSFQTLKCSNKFIHDLQHGATFTAEILEKFPYGTDEYTLRKKENEYISRTESWKNGYNCGFVGYLNPKLKKSLVFPPAMLKQSQPKPITLRIPKEKYIQIQESAVAAGESVNGYIKRAIDERMERDNQNN